MYYLKYKAGEAIFKFVLKPDLGLAISGPDDDQASSVEKSSFHTGDEKDTGREIAILYPTAALDIKLNNSFKTGKIGLGLAILVPTVVML